MASNAVEASGEDFVIGDITKIQQVIENAIEEFSKVLVKQNICTETQSIKLAEDILLRGGKLQPNGPGEDDNPDPDPYRKKFPSFLFICAPENPLGEKRENELKQREYEAQNLMKMYHKDFKFDKYNTVKTADTYDDMLKEITGFVSNTQLSHLPIIVFLGHGSEDGKLCFCHSPDIHCLQALDDVCERFTENRPREMPEWQLRFVFAQCYASSC